MKINTGFPHLNALDNVDSKKRGTAPQSKVASQSTDDVAEPWEISVSERLNIAPASGADAPGHETRSLSKVRTVLSGFKSTYTVLNRMQKLAAAVSESTAGLNMSDIKNEFVSLKAEIDGIALSTAYLEKQENGLDGALEYEFKPEDAKALGVDSLTIGGFTEAAQAVAGIKKAIQNISAKIKHLEKMQSRIEDRILSTSDDWENAPVKVSSMESAKQFSMKVNIMVLKYKRNAMMAQANAAPQRVLSLIGK
jgi:flagellin